MIERLMVGAVIAALASAFTMIVISGNIKRECRISGVLVIDGKTYTCQPATAKQANYTT
jgi:hypothetical protein